ncbi:MAG TPA: M14 family zinc carboxypeptidase [Bryobacteraceae bacterium]
MMIHFGRSSCGALAILWFAVALAGSLPAQGDKTKTLLVPQKQDEAYTALIKKYLQDPRITTELVDHMPASDTVPSPLAFFGRIPGTPGELTYAKDIHRYYDALAAASPRARYWTIGKTEEGRDQVILAIADEATLKQLDQYKGMLASLADPRKTTEADAQRLIKTAKPIYWITSGIHSPETGGPEMLIELAYRLIVEETPFIQMIRNNVVVFITPVVEVDGREKEVDTYYYGKRTGKPKPPLMYWGKYVQHDNNRDGMGQFLQLTQNITRSLLEWHPTILHDLHEAQSYLYVSTGTGPYNDSLDPIQVNEWWLLAETEVMEMAKRGVPGVWTYGFYDGWVPNYLFWIAMTHNSFGRFYEVQSYGPDINKNLRLPASTTSREWFRPNPPLPSIAWGPRNNTNIQESAILIALNQVARTKQLYLENYWLKTKRSIQKGKDGPTYAWVIPAAQRRKLEAAAMVNALERQGLEVHQANSAFKAGSLEVAAGDYIIRADQPYRELADMYFAIQNYPVANPHPYDDTGWTMQYMRNVKLIPVTDKLVLDAPMTLLPGEVKIPGSIAGTGDTLIVDHTTDNALMAFRFRNAGVKMAAAEQDFEAGGHRFHAGAFLIPNADRATIEPSIQDLGLSAWAVSSVPQVKTHDLDVPRIGYIHSWSRTQDEGWVRAALDTYSVPYTYFADQKLRDGDLRAKYDVIVFPHVGGTPQSQVNGIPLTGKDPIPYKKSDLTPNLGANDESDDIRGGMGLEGLGELAKFVRAGGTLITEGSTAALVVDYGLVSGLTVEDPHDLAARGTIVRGVITDSKSPITYGFDTKDLPVYFNQEPVLNAAPTAGGFGGGGGFGGQAAYGQVITPNATPLHILPLDPNEAPPKAAETPQITEAESARERARALGLPPEVHPRIIMRFPSDPNEMLLSGMLSGGQRLSNRVLIADVSLGKGHIVMFALRPFWRWQTQGTFFLGFNAILNWNDLDAGKPEPKP